MNKLEELKAAAEAAAEAWEAAPAVWEAAEAEALAIYKATHEAAVATWEAYHAELKKQEESNAA